VPEGAMEPEAIDAIALAFMGLDDEVRELYEQVKRLARDRAGYLRERLEEDNPISRARRRVYGDRLEWGRPMTISEAKVYPIHLIRKGS